MQEYTLDKNKLGSWLIKFISLAWKCGIQVAIYHKPTKKWQSVLVVDEMGIGLVSGVYYNPISQTKVRLLK